MYVDTGTYRYTGHEDRTNDFQNVTFRHTYIASTSLYFEKNNRYDMAANPELFHMYVHIPVRVLLFFLYAAMFR